MEDDFNEEDDRRCDECRTIGEDVGAAKK